MEGGGWRVEGGGKSFNPKKRVWEGERFAPHPSPLPGEGTNPDGISTMLARKICRTPKPLSLRIV